MKTGFLLALILFNLFWAASLSIYKSLGHYLDYSGIVTLRFGVAAVGALILWPWLPGKTPRGRDLIKTIVMGVTVFVLGHRLQVFGNQLGTAGNSSVLMAVEPLITSVAAALFLREHIAARRWMGFGLGMLGVVLLNGIWRPDFQPAGLAPSLIFIASFLGEAAYSVMGKPLIARAGLLKVLALALISGTLLNLALDGPLTLAAAKTLPSSAWLQLGFLGLVCTLLGYAIWFVVLRETDVNAAALTIFIQPLAGVPIAAWCLGEPLHWGQFWGSLVILAGLVLGLARQDRTKAAPPAASAAIS